MKKSKPRQAVEKQLEQMYSDVLNMSARERRTLWKDLSKLNETNCSWVIYSGASVLRDFIMAASSKP